MKKIPLILGFAFYFIQGNIFGQTNSIKNAPLDMVIGGYSLTYERAFSDRISLLFTARYSDFLRRADSETGAPTFLRGDRYTQAGFDWELVFRRYFKSHIKMEGFFLEYGFRLADYDITYEKKGNIFFGVNNGPDFIEKLNVYSIALSTGCQGLLGGHFILEMGFGVRMNRVFETLDPENFPNSARLNGMVLIGNLKLGYAF